MCEVAMYHLGFVFELAICDSANCNDARLQKLFPNNVFLIFWTKNHENKRRTYRGCQKASPWFESARLVDVLDEPFSAKYVHLTSHPDVKCNCVPVLLVMVGL